MGLFQAAQLQQMGEQAGQGTSQDQQGWNGDKIDVDQDSQKQGSGRDRGTDYQVLDPGQQQFPFRGACVFCLLIVI